MSNLRREKNFENCITRIFLTGSNGCHESDFAAQYAHGIQMITVVSNDRVNKDAIADLNGNYLMDHW